MAVPKRFVVAPNAATRELWRVAENGEIHELEELLPRASINARNEHGMTALMRAACHGRVQMVRALLEHGADPNLARNDNFTALSLAAFFGHTEIVEMLIGYGARTDVATRYGTSAQMWAKARSFGDVAQCLQKRRKEEVVPAPLPTPVPAPRPEPVRETQPQAAEPKLELPLVVRTLSEPPEIWDLVHEAPRDFSAGSAFVGRVGSITAGVALGVVGFLVVAAGIVGVWYWKDRIPRPVAAAPPPPTVTNVVSAPTAPAPVNQSVVDVPSISVPEPVARPRRPVIKPRITQVPVEASTDPPPAPVAPKSESQSANATTTKPAPSPASSQLISPPKTQQPKAKVIQWP